LIFAVSAAIALVAEGEFFLFYAIFFIRGEHLSPRVRASQLGLTKGSQHSNHIVIIHGRLFTLMTKAVAGANPTGIFQLSRAIIFW
jgi:hypothetical protein